MEDEVVSSPCPVCGREVIGSFATHLQLHTKQDLILTIISQHDALGLFLRQPKSPSSDQSEERGRRSTSPPKKAGSRTGRRKSSGSSLAPARDQRGREVTGHPPLTSTSEPTAQHQSGSQPLMLELEIGQYGNTEPETTEIMPIQICSYISDPGTEDTPNEPNPQLQTLYPMDSQDRHATSHSNFIQYIIETPVSGNDGNQEIAEWILPGGRTIPVYSSLTSGPTVQEEDPLSLDGENSSSRISRGKLQTSTTQQSDVDLMTDEEIPPRGEISEYEESNTSSHQSDELNKPGIMSIGSTLGSLFRDVRRLPPVVEHESSNDKTKRPQVQKKGKSKKCNGDPIEVKSLGASTSITIACVRSTATEDAGHKCPDPNCTQVGSIFELAKHQEKVHQRKYKGLKAKENSSHSQSGGSRQQAPTMLDQDQKPILIRLMKPRRIRKSSSYQCSYCPFNSDKLKILQGHFEEAHPGKVIQSEQYECTTCGKMFLKKVNLTKHLLIHGVKKFQCDCGKAFTSGFKLMEHNRVHTKEYPFQCIQCHRHFRTPSLLKAHIVRVHPLPGITKPVIKNKVEFFCGICSRVLHSKRSYTKHLELHNEKSQKCPICSETFPRNAILTRHIRVTHDSSYETKESKDCPICFKKMHPNSMKSHMRIHNDEKPFSCPVCSKSFRTAANLTSHSWSHTNAEKPFKCTLCSKSYLFKKCLEAHLIVHKKRGFHFVCNECGMKFTRKVNLKRHCLEHFSEKKYKCKLCPKKFHRMYYLVEHERIHNGSKPYNCIVCGKTSTTRSNHRAHIKIHDARESGTQEG